MTNQGLQLEVRRFCGTPLVTAKGRMDGLHTATLTRLLRSFKWRGHENIIIDFTGVNLVGADGTEALVSMMRGWHPEMTVHIAANGEVSQVLSAGSLPYPAHLCSSLDEAAEQICRSHRTMAPATQRTGDWLSETDLPMAA